MKFLFVAITSACLALSSMGAIALTKDDVEKMTPEQQGKIDVYEVYRVAIGSQATQSLNLDEVLTKLIKRNMAMLLYPVDMSVFSIPEKDVKFKEHIKQLQKRMDAPQTGLLLKEQFDVLSNAASTLMERKVFPPPGMLISGSIAGQIIAQGTWVMDDDAFPVNYSKIRCEKSEQVCTEVGLSVAMPHQFFSDDDFNVMLDEATKYKVVTWESDEVTAVAESLCRKTRLTINTTTKQASLVTTDNSKDGCTLPTGGNIPNLGKPRVATLGDGFKEPKKKYDARNKQAQKLLYQKFGM